MQLATKFVGTLLWIAAATFILAASAASAQTYPPDVDNVSAGTEDDTPDAGAEVEVFGTVVDEDGDPVEGAEVTFTISSGPGGGTFSNGSTTIVATTNSDGIATVTLTTGDDEGATVVQVASGGVTSQVTVTTGAPQALPPTGGEPLGQGGSTSSLMAVLGIAALVLAGGGLIAFRKTSAGA